MAILNQLLRWMDMRWPGGGLWLARFLFGEGEKITIFIGRWTGWRIESGLVGLVGTNGLRKCIVDFQNSILGAV